MYIRLFTLSLLSVGILHAAEAGFDRTLSKDGISYHVQATQEGSLNTLTVTPKGFSSSNRPESTEIEGSVTDAKIADINGDGAPEVYVFITSAGSGSYGSLVAYSSNKNKSMSAIYLPELEPKSKEAKGYMGHDTFTLTKDRLVRSFPVYNDKDPNCCPSGGTRKLVYKLVPGEAGWKLELVESRTEKKAEKEG
jgi:hypothetical protein